MRQLLEKKIRRLYPIDDRLDGWFFRLNEASPGHLVAEGTDLWGRKVSCEASLDCDDPLEACVRDAKSVADQIEESQEQ